MVVAFYNQKGGVGKTTLGWVLAEGVAHSPSVKRILVIDNDSQCNLTDTMLKDTKAREEAKTSNILNCYKGAPVTDNILETENEKINLLPGHDLINDTPITETSLANILAPFITGEYKDHYDYIMIDNGPASGPMQRGALLVSDMIIAPYTPETYCLDALIKMQKHIEPIGAWEKVKIVPNMIKKTTLSYAYLNSGRKLWNTKVTKTEITYGQEFHLAKELQKSIYLKRMGSGKIWLLLVDLINELFGLDAHEITKAIWDEKKFIKGVIAKANFAARYARTESTGE
jgi:cellulose biosynthesis protein BcsQ